MAASSKRDAAATYQKIATSQTREGRQFIAELSPQPGALVLDLGCGTGELAAHLADLVGPSGKVVGVDPDSERIKLAQQTYQHVKNLTFVEGSGEQFPDIGMGKYDLIFSNCVLHWISNKQSVFDVAYRSIKPNGRFAALFEDKDLSQMDKICALLFPQYPQRLSQDPFTFEDTNTVRRYLQQSGFTAIKATEFKPRATFKTLLDVCEWLEGVLHGQINSKMISTERLEKADLSFMRNDDGGEDEFMAEFSAVKIVASKTA